MNLQEQKYNQYALCREMLESSNVVANFNQDFAPKFIPAIQTRGKLLLTGEGSSRIFPAKHFINQIRTLGFDLFAFTEGALQSSECRMEDFVVFGVSNSGKTKELVFLFEMLKQRNHQAFYGVTATRDTPVELIPVEAHVLTCGKEEAVAATKSVIEQALVYETLLYALNGAPLIGLKGLSLLIRDVLHLSIEDHFVETFCKAPVIYYAGRNDGVAEELTLKTNEITRKKAVFLEGTYALHGIEEVMRNDELLIIIDPFEMEEEKFREVIEQGVGMQIIAISSRPTSFPTILIPDGGKFKNYVELAAGWNLLVEVGIKLGVNLDKPSRARKIGNESNLK